MSFSFVCARLAICQLFPLVTSCVFLLLRPETSPHHLKCHTPWATWPSLCPAQSEPKVKANTKNAHNTVRSDVVQSRSSSVRNVNSNWVPRLCLICAHRMHLRCSSLLAFHCIHMWWHCHPPLEIKRIKCNKLFRWWRYWRRQLFSLPPSDYTNLEIDLLHFYFSFYVRTPAHTSILPLN